MVCFPAVKIVKQWRKIFKEILKYLSGQAQEQVRQKSKGGFNDALSCLRAVHGTRHHLPSSFPFPGLISFSWQSTYLMITKITDK